MSGKTKKPKYEKPELVDLTVLHAVGACGTGSADSAPCTTGNSAGGNCSQGNTASGTCISTGTNTAT